jgi:hypothetical protein
MPKFISPRDVNFFQHIAREVVNEVIQNIVVLFKINLNETKINLYGESLSKTWHPGVELFALINKETQQATYEGFGADMGQSVEFRFDRSFCEETNVYPEIGDVIFFDNRYYEIDTKTENQFVGGQSYNNFSIVCSTFAVREATLNISKRIN